MVVSEQEVKGHFIGQNSCRSVLRWTDLDQKVLLVRHGRRGAAAALPALLLV